ncbi:hypothetical protein BCV72DRAFT_215036, partial [Rhizopus microsporus var. microsporus]
LSEQRMNVRSLVTSFASQHGLPVGDIQTLDNWITLITFHNCYRRENLSTVDFTNIILS